ncbi:MAG: lysophospholipid acyltransferase family protein [Pseudomonadota bacterium]
MKLTRRRIGKRLLSSEGFQTAAAAGIHGYFWAVFKSNRFVSESDDVSVRLEPHMPAIIAVWHGQQFLVPFFKGEGYRIAALVSKSRDAEINAKVLQRFDVEVIRGSGGRVRGREYEKGGVRALKALTGTLARGNTVVMIADISKGTPRRAGRGIVTLAKLSGRPVIPAAIATSRHHIVEKSWDKTTINLPFGRICLKLGDPVYVPRDASEADVERSRQMVTDELNSATEGAYRAVRNEV